MSARIPPQDGDTPTGELPPLSLYIHFPWCVSKCPYCDFNSHALQGEVPEQRYLAALLADAAVQRPRVADREVSSLFLGGGTPSLFTPDALAELLTALRALLHISSAAEITLEANPATVERGRFAAYRGAGINRVSLGAQSFDDVMLKRLGRIHQREDVVRAAAELHAAGLANFNLDLMYALPQQDLQGALDDIAAALALEPAHISHYQLTLEPGTLFAAQPPPLPDDDLAWAMQQECQGALAASGFGHYEVSAYARAGFQCHHNLNYWEFGDYLGIGAGAHGKLTVPGPARTPHDIEIWRSAHLREPRRYFASAAGGPAWRAVPPADLPFEFLMNALRLTRGFTPQQFTARTGLEAALLDPAMEELLSQGLLERSGAHLRATPRGLQFLNEVLQRFLPSENSPVAASS